MQALILAGGFGTRLKTIVADKPKALSPVAGKPFLSYVIDFLLEEGVNDFVFSLGYLSEQVISFLNEQYSNLNYTYFVESEPLGTGGAIKACFNLITSSNVLIVNADTYFDVPVKTMFSLHNSTKSACTIAVKKMQNFERYGSVIIDEDSSIISFKEKKFVEKGLINGGFIILNIKEFQDKTEKLLTAFSFEKDFLENHLSQITVKAFESKGLFIDIGIPEDFERAQLVFANFAFY